METALAEGASQTGVSLMQVVREMDAGGVADVESVDIEKTDTSLRLRAKMGQAVVPLMRRNLALAVSGGLHFQPQDASKATHCRKITKEDAAFDFTLPAEKICARLRAFTPWPGGYFESSGERIKAGLCHSLDEHTDQLPGTVLPFAEDGCLRIACERVYSWFASCSERAGVCCLRPIFCVGILCRKDCCSKVFRRVP